MYCSLFERAFPVSLLLVYVSIVLWMMNLFIFFNTRLDLSVTKTSTPTVLYSKSVERSSSLTTIDIAKRYKIAKKDIDNRKVLYRNELLDVKRCKVNLESSFCNSSLLDTEKQLLFDYYYNPQINRKRYTAVLGTTFVITDENSRNFIQRYFMDSIIIFSKYTHIKFVVFTNSNLVIKECIQRNITYSTNYKANPFKVPSLKSIIATLESEYDAWFYGYLNGDILLSLNFEDVLLNTLESIYKKQLKSEVIIVTTRSNIVDTFFYNKTFNNNNEYINILNQAYHESTYAESKAIDVFIATKYTFTNHLFEDAVIGRFYIDGYIIDYANFRSDDIDTVDITPSTLSIHMSGTEHYKNVQRGPDKLYNGRYFTSKDRAGLCDINMANYAIKQKDKGYELIENSREDYMKKVRNEFKLLTCYYKYKLNNQC
ncbi:hypothetical protein WA158_001719 [Blastocystis sp. Blastoise]